jgi:hypothetical protein
VPPPPGNNPAVCAVTVIAGIDEAGYGPRLGPLVTSAAALGIEGTIAGAGLEPPPCLWERLSGCVARPGRRSGRRLAVGDSKAIYSSGGRLDGLERATLAFAALAGSRGLAERPAELLAQLLSDRCRSSLAEHPWYADRGEQLPLDGERAVLADAAGELADGCRRSGVRAVQFASRVLAEGEYNRRVARTDNKATVLLELVTELLAGLRAAAGAEALSVVVDRLGGRTDYAPLLTAAFPGGFVWRLGSGAEEQAYRVDGLAGPTVVRFRIKADRDCFSTALASMVSKYLRELHMRRFNAWWRELDPGLPATTGYHADAGPFLDAARPHRERLELADAMLIRSR